MPRFCGSRFWHYYRRRRRLRRRLFRVTFGRLLRAAVERKGVTKRKVSRALFNTHWFKVLKFRVTKRERGGERIGPEPHNRPAALFRKTPPPPPPRERERERKERESSSFSLLLLWWFESARKKDGKREEREREAHRISKLQQSSLTEFSLCFGVRQQIARLFSLSLSLARASERGGERRLGGKSRRARGNGETRYRRKEEHERERERERERENFRVKHHRERRENKRRQKKAKRPKKERKVFDDNVDGRSTQNL